MNRDATLAANNGYDANGNLINDGTRTYNYDEENHLVTVNSGGTTMLSLSYDPLRRLQQTAASGIATNFVYDSDDLIAELNSSDGVLRRYLPGPEEDEPLIWFEGAAFTTPRSLHADAQGSIIGWSDGGANRGGVFTYGPYGERSSWSGPRYTYTGQIALPEASLYYYKARIYDPVRGWFLQTDPVGYKADLNLYAYSHEDPMNNVDPSGLEAGCVSNGGNCVLSPSYHIFMSIHGYSAIIGFGHGAVSGGYTVIGPNGKVVESGYYTTETHGFGLNPSVTPVGVCEFTSPSMPDLDGTDKGLSFDIMGLGGDASTSGVGEHLTFGPAPPGTLFIGSSHTMLRPLTGVRAPKKSALKTAPGTKGSRPAAAAINTTNTTSKNAKDSKQKDDTTGFGAAFCRGTSVGNIGTGNIC